VSGLPVRGAWAELASAGPDEEAGAAAGAGAVIAARLEGREKLEKLEETNLGRDNGTRR
jgi:hypothetical protein